MLHENLGRCPHAMIGTRAWVTSAATRGEPQAFAERALRQRDEDYKAKRAQLPRATYGPEPENGYADWQRYAIG